MSPKLVLATVIMWGCGKSCTPVTVREFRTTEISYSDLSLDQQKLFKKAHPDQNAERAWHGLNLSEQIEFAAGTRALAGVCSLTKCVDSLVSIHGDLGDSHPSAEQFNVELNWTLDALDMKNLPGWSDHIAVLHPGQFGYQENRDGNPFLGLIVLFDENHVLDKIHGQFHIDFRSWFAHFERMNGNIGDQFNYECYCDWYHPFDTFHPVLALSPVALGLPDQNQQAVAAKSDLVESIEDFLEAWYVQRNYSQFRSYIASENAYEVATRARKPHISVERLIGGLFSGAFLALQNPLSSSPKLGDLIYAPVISTLGQEIHPLLDRRQAGARLFSVFAADQFPTGSMLPRPHPKDDAAKFLLELRRKYDVRIVIYVTKPDRGLLPETAIMYWIQQKGGAWRLAAYQGTDW